MSHSIGIVKSIAHRAVDSDAMIEIASCNVLPGRGLDTENRKPGKREITLVSAESWADVCREMGQDIPWWTRRANLLVEGIDLAATIGQRIRIGPVEIHIHGETKPCRLMDAQVQGLTRVMVPNLRGGVHGQVLTGGAIRIGDSVGIMATA
ncbi:MAG: MOSC domain-containing protein [Planctomycetes bacterium]|nr:MOSC domain-containing protein [Planctomycetota bacterium]